MVTKARNQRVWRKAKYFPIQKHWRKLAPIFRSREARNIWHPCMEEFMERRADEHGYPHKPRPDAKFPTSYESCDWRYNREISYSRQPKFWDYARFEACHWVADLALYVAMTVFPAIPWRILYCQKHTTVWNGSVSNPVLFDINFNAMGIEASEAMKIASKGREFKPGKYLKAYLHRKS